MTRCMWSGRRWLWLAAVITATSHRYLCQGCTEGELRVTGTNTTDFIAGRIELCDGVEWRAVCHDQGRWGMADAMVVCRQLGFPAEEASYCTYSCFGKNAESKGIWNFGCTGIEEKLQNCPSRTSGGCVEDAGVVCTNTRTVTPVQPTLPPLECTCAATDGCMQLQATTAETTPITTTGEVEGGTSGSVTTVGSTARSSTSDSLTSTGTRSGTVGGTATSSPKTSSGLGSDQMEINCPANPGQTHISIALGILSAVLVILLVGVALGCAWSCRRTRGKSGTHERLTPGEVNLNNPIYSSTSPQPAIQYSSLGPKNTPHNMPTPDNPDAPIPQGARYGMREKGGEADYEDPDKQGGGAEGIYHMLGEEGGEGEGRTDEGQLYEVPVPSVPQYSVLQHHH